MIIFFCHLLLFALFTERIATLQAGMFLDNKRYPVRYFYLYWNIIFVLVVILGMTSFSLINTQPDHNRWMIVIASLSCGMSIKELILPLVVNLRRGNKARWYQLSSNSSLSRSAPWDQFFLSIFSGREKLAFIAKAVASLIVLLACASFIINHLRTGIL